MIQTFWLVFLFYPCFSYLCFNFMYMSILSKLCLFCPNCWLYIYILEPLAFMHILLWTRCVWICMYSLVCTRHTYALKIKSFWWFSCFKEFLFELNCLFSWLCFSPKTYTLTLFEVFSWFYFHESYMSFISFECQLLSDFHVLWNIILFYSLLEGFRTSLQIFHITSSYSSLW